jgi:2-oxoglutarate dehydrogenase E2 component (dihydrolipoamide succinyltransferase)
MPQWGMGMTEGTITRWLKAEGETVDFDEPLVEVETAKAEGEITAPVTGKLTKILVQEDETVPVQELLALIDEQA